MKVLLLRPGYVRRSYFTRFNLSEALTEIYVGPVLADRHEVRVVDLRVRPDLERELQGWVPDAAVVAVHPQTLGGLDALLARLRRLAPRLRVLLVGAAEYGIEHLVERPQDFMRPLADALVPGFYLRPVRRIVAEALAAWDDGRALRDVPGLWIRDGGAGGGANGWQQTAVVPHTVGDIGVPDRTLLGRARGAYSLGGVRRMAYVVYTFGCRYSCRYCSMSKVGGSIQTPRAIRDVIAELAELSEPNVFLSDFEPLQAPQAMLELADAIEAAGIRKRWYLLTRADSALEQADVLERWKEIGLRWVFLGLDGHSEARLQQIGKGATLATNEAAVAVVRRLGLGPAVGITVPPDATRQEFVDIAGGGAAPARAAGRLHGRDADGRHALPRPERRAADDPRLEPLRHAPRRAAHGAAAGRVLPRDDPAPRPRRPAQRAGDAAPVSAGRRAAQRARRPGGDARSAARGEGPRLGLTGSTPTGGKCHTPSRRLGRKLRALPSGLVAGPHGRAAPGRRGSRCCRAGVAAAPDSARRGRDSLIAPPGTGLALQAAPRASRPPVPCQPPRVDRP
jgi:hypothetical protein